MIDFKEQDRIKIIKLAVKIIANKLTQGESINFSSFVVAAAYQTAQQVIKDNPNAIAEEQN